MSDEDWSWELSSDAQGDIETLSTSEQDRIVEKLDEITEIQGESLALQRGDESDIICSKPQDVDYP
jgi:hypothetical protein